MRRELIKTLTYLMVHLTVGFTVVYVMTGSVALAGGIALIEPCINAIAFFFHERAWGFDWSRLVPRPPRSADDSRLKCTGCSVVGAW
jgi:uncharacterized membrane protein